MPAKLPINLQDLLHQRTVEGERIEYKAGWNPDATVRTLCAFANDFANLGGGYLVIGQDCDDDGKPVFPPVGVAANQVGKIQREPLAACQLIQPPYFPWLSVERVEGALQKALGLANAEHFRKAYLLPALPSGAVEMTLPDAPRSSRQRYRLTALGQHIKKRSS